MRAVMTTPAVLEILKYIIMAPERESEYLLRQHVSRDHMFLLLENERRKNRLEVNNSSLTRNYTIYYDIFQHYVVTSVWFLQHEYSFLPNCLVADISMSYNSRVNNKIIICLLVRIHKRRKHSFACTYQHHFIT